jgi:Holliday junction resolvase-like predicted endonuclease
MREADLESQTSELTWHEFEVFSERAFSSAGFFVTRNFRVKKPRMEIDLLAIKGSLAFCVDCKHWKRTVGQGSMLRISESQVLRSERLLSPFGFSRIVPMILTLKDESLGILENGVPIVPIHRLADFLLNWETSEILVLSSPRTE